MQIIPNEDDIADIQDDNIYTKDKNNYDDNIIEDEASDEFDSGLFD